MYKVTFAFVLFLAWTSGIHAQNQGELRVNKDSLIVLLQEFRAEAGLNPTALRKVTVGAKTTDKKNTNRVKVRGFRVQIFSGPNRNDAYAVQSRFNSQFKEYGSYINYDEPNYRVKVGDFRSRSEATRFMNVLRAHYNNVFIFTEDIWVYE